MGVFSGCSSHSLWSIPASVSFSDNCRRLGSSGAWNRLYVEFGCVCPLSSEQLLVLYLIITVILSDPSPSLDRKPMLCHDCRISNNSCLVKVISVKPKKLKLDNCLLIKDSQLMPLFRKNSQSNITLAPCPMIYILRRRSTNSSTALCLIMHQSVL